MVYATHTHKRREPTLDLEGTEAGSLEHKREQRNVDRREAAPTNACSAAVSPHKLHNTRGKQHDSR